MPSRLIASLLLAMGPIAGAAAGETQPEPRPELLLADPQRHLHASGFADDGGLWLTRESANFAHGELVVVRYPPRPGEAPRALPLQGDARGAAWLSPVRSLVFTSQRATGQATAADLWNLWLAEPSGERWSAPVPLPYPVNTPFAECCAVSAPDGTLLFASDRAGTWDIYHAVPADRGAWRVERLAGAVNGEPPAPGARGYFGEWPSFVDPAGRYLLLSSIRPGGLGGDDVYLSCRGVDGSWGAARNLGAPVNTPGYEDAALVTPAGDELLWSARREGETSRIHRLSFDAASWCPPTAVTAP